VVSRLRHRLVSAEHGFTMIELLIVVVIVGILLTVSVVALVGFRGRSNDTVAKANVRAIVPAIESYYSDYHAYDNMTLTELASSYDQGIDSSRYSLSGLTASSFCVSSTLGGQTWRKVGPAGPIVQGTPC
jgi:prepilin-type N-terminal cleavage/methylation domain-containing protein